MVELFEKLLKEWHTIRAAPRSFILVCVIAVALFYVAFHFYYSEKLASAKRSASEWKDSADHWKESQGYWKDRAEGAERQPPQTKCEGPTPNTASKKPPQKPNK